MRCGRDNTAPHSPHHPRTGQPSCDTVNSPKTEEDLYLYIKKRFKKLTLFYRKKNKVFLGIFFFRKDVGSSFKNGRQGVDGKEAEAVEDRQTITF